MREPGLRARFHSTLSRLSRAIHIRRTPCKRSSCALGFAPALILSASNGTPQAVLLPTAAATLLFQFKTCVGSSLSCARCHRWTGPWSPAQMEHQQSALKGQRWWRHHASSASVGQHEPTTTRSAGRSGWWESGASCTPLRRAGGELVRGRVSGQPAGPHGHGCACVFGMPEPARIRVARAKTQPMRTETATKTRPMRTETTKMHGRPLRTSLPSSNALQPQRVLPALR